MAREIGRRAFLQAAGTAGLLGLIAPSRLDELLTQAARAAGPARFLDAHELDTLRALCGRLIPGPPDDPDPGAREARCPEAIDLLLGAFEGGPPPIHAGGPFSDRNGSAHDDFADFVALDAHAELGWRIRIEGSQGLAEREFAGPVQGLQEIYRHGLKHLDKRSNAGFALDFKDAPSVTQDLLLADQSDDEIQSFLGTALGNTVEFMYGPPEYGGNAGLVGWKFTSWPGDTQPQGFSDSAVSSAGPAHKLSKRRADRALPFLKAIPEGLYGPLGRRVGRP